MYSIREHNGYLKVEFNEDFDFNTIQAVIHHVTSMHQYFQTNDIWVIGSHHAHIRLGEIETMVGEFQCRCPRDAQRTKTAIVVDEGFTHAIIELWVSALHKKIAFDMQIFDNLSAAEVWLAGERELSV